MLLPHGVPSRTGKRRNGLVSTHTLVVALMAAIPSYFLGTLTSMYAGIQVCEDQSIQTLREESQTQQRLQELEQSLTQKFEASLPERCAALQQDASDVAASDVAASDVTAPTVKYTDLFPIDDVGHMYQAMARTTKQEFTDHLDLGVPLDPMPGEKDSKGREADKGARHVIMLYSAKSIPDVVKESSDPVPVIPIEQALENCHYLNVVFQGETQRNKMCTAIIPQYESYHIRKWMRIDQSNKLNETADLQYVSRNHLAEGLRTTFAPPGDMDRRKSWDMLSTYFGSIDDVLADLKPICERIAIQKTIIVMVCNFGQSELLMNFVCAANSRGLDISNVLVFATDAETMDLATSLGLTAYYDQRNFNNTPTLAAGVYGDSRFIAMMMAKAIVVQVISMLGYDILFQDVDIVWFKNPLDYFHNASNPVYNYDVFFQDDGQHSTRYAPYSSNSGFYFVRNNDRTVHFLTKVLMSADVVIKTDSHQQALVAVLNEHASLFGLKVKVLPREMEEFPGGYQFNQLTGKYMRAYYKGEVDPIIFHMSWTLNKEDKLKYFQQMGEWYVQDQCIQTKVEDIPGAQNKTGDDFRSTCCAAKPLVTCHYADKPSVIDCSDSPLMDKGKRKKFWPL